MAIGSGLSNQLMMAPEASYGAVTTPSLAIEYNSESLKYSPDTLESRGSSQIVLRSGRWRRYTKSAGGQVELDFMQRSMGKILAQMYGVSAIAQVGTTAEWVQTHTPDLTGGGLGISAVWQIGRAQTNGTVVPFTFHGGKVTQWELRQDIDANLKLQLTLDAKPTSDTATALATAVYAASLTPLAFIDATLTLGGSSVDVRSLILNHTRALATDRRFLGNTKKEPIANGEWVFGGSLDKEFEDTALYNAFIAGETAALVATWAYGQIGTTGNPFKLVITIPEIRYDDATPAGNGSDLVTQTVPFKALNNGINPIETAEYHSDDVAL